MLMLNGMFGRALFAVVWLIIAAGILLPIYPVGVETGPPSAGTSVAQAGAVAPGCQDCAVVGEDGTGCQPDCMCAPLLPAAFVVVEAPFVLSIHLIIRPRPLGLPFEVQPLPPKLPAI